ncbi:MAG: MAPEG family protein [Nitratireductor sp.]|nr:MAPEG family protein [Nitratireductor sp.]
MTFQITAFYAAILAIMMIALSTWVTLLRARLKISILHGDSLPLAERIRMHGNFIENVPMAIIIMGLAEAGGTSPMVLNTMGLMLVAGRILHPMGLRHDKPATFARIAGGSLTTLATLAGVFLILSSALQA